MDNEEILKECYNCGSEHDLSDMHLIDNEWYCDDCISYCEQCDCVCLSDELTYVSSSHHDGMYMCDECIDNHTFTCDHCGDITFDSEMIGDGNISLCQYCYENSYGTCYSCDNIFHNMNYTTLIILEKYIVKRAIMKKRITKIHAICIHMDISQMQYFTVLIMNPTFIGVMD